MWLARNSVIFMSSDRRYKIDFLHRFYLGKSESNWQAFLASGERLSEGEVPIWNRSGRIGCRWRPYVCPATSFPHVIGAGSIIEESGRTVMLTRADRGPGDVLFIFSESNNAIVLAGQVLSQ